MRGAVCENRLARTRRMPPVIPLRLRELLTLTDEELACQDIAVVNLACAEGLPGAEEIDHAFCLGQLNAWAEMVRQHTERLLRTQFSRRPWDFHHSEAYFRALDLITVLQRDLGVRYNPAKIPEDAPFDTADCFLHGILQGDGGTCASLPVLYAAVGRRLGYPLRLVPARGTSFNHLFVRWDDPAGERFNMEATSRGLNCYPDDYYRTGRYVADAQAEQLGGYLRSQTPREELAGFLAERGFLWRQHGAHRQAVNSLAWAWAFAPGNKLRANSLIRAMNAWGDELRRLEPPGFPEMYCAWRPPRRFPAGLPEDFERDIRFLEAWESILRDAEHESTWWEPLRRGQGSTGPARAFIVHSETGCSVRFAWLPNSPRPFGR